MSKKFQTHERFITRNIILAKCKCISFLVIQFILLLNAEDGAFIDFLPVEKCRSEISVIAVDFFLLHPFIQSIHSLAARSVRDQLIFPLRKSTDHKLVTLGKVRFSTQLFGNSHHKTFIRNNQSFLGTHNALDQLSIRPYQTFEIFFLLADTRLGTNC